MKQVNLKKVKNRKRCVYRHLISICGVTKDDICIKCFKLYERLWYKDNRIAQLERSKKVYKNNRKKILKRSKKYRIKNKKLIKLRGKKYRKLNRRKEQLRHKIYRNSHKNQIQKWYQRNREKVRIYKINWRHKNKKILKIKTKKYRAKKRGLIRLQILRAKKKRALRIPKFGQVGISNFYLKCQKNKVVDHIIPLQGKLVSGLHVNWNLQYLPVKKNIIKGNRVDLEKISKNYGKLLKKLRLK